MDRLLHQPIFYQRLTTSASKYVQGDSAAPPKLSPEEAKEEAKATVSGRHSSSGGLMSNLLMLYV